MKKLILFLISFVLLMQLASAVDVVSFFIENNQDEITISQGHSADFNVFAGAARPFDIRIWLENGNGQEIRELIFIEDYDDEEINGRNVIFERNFRITFDMYQDIGDYTVHVFANDGFRPDNAVLTLNVVENRAPQVRVIFPNGEELLSRNINIRWTAEDPENDNLNIDIDYSNNNGQSWNNLFRNTANDGTEQLNTRNLANGYQYLIRATASDMINSASDVSDDVFGIINNNDPVIELLSPGNNQQNVPINQILRWRGSDADNDRLTYDVYLNGNRIGNDIVNTEYPLENLNFNTRYEWHVFVSDEITEVRSQSFTFTTINEVNNAPTILLISPSNNANNIPINIELIWEGFDQDNDRLTYDVYFNNQLVANDIENQEYNIRNLNYDTIYSWYIIISDGELETRSPLWNFRTVERELENIPPTVDIISPRPNSVINDVQNIIWNAEDEDGRIVRTRIYYKGNKGIPLIGPLMNLFNGYKLLIELPGNPESYLLDTKQFRNGRYQFKVQVFDDRNIDGNDEIRLKILNEILENFAPRIVSQPVTSVIVNTNYLYDVDAVDLEDDIISYDLTENPEGMVIDSNTGVITWIPNRIGNYDIVVRARDIFGHFSIQRYVLNVIQEEVITPKRENIIHEFSIKNVILGQDSKYVNIYVKIDNDGNQNERVQLRAINTNTGDITYESFLLENGDGYWRILMLPKPDVNGVYTIGVWGNSKDANDLLYRDVII